MHKFIDVNIFFTFHSHSLFLCPFLQGMKFKHEINVVQIFIDFKEFPSIDHHTSQHIFSLDSRRHITLHRASELRSAYVDKTIVFYSPSINSQDFLVARNDGERIEYKKPGRRVCLQILFLQAFPFSSHASSLVCVSVKRSVIERAKNKCKLIESVLLRNKNRKSSYVIYQVHIMSKVFIFLLIQK